MAASVIPKAGSKYGHCEEGCDHIDCAEQRDMASSVCNECDEPIGYEARFYRDEYGLYHARCLE